MSKLVVGMEVSFEEAEAVLVSGGMLSRSPTGWPVRYKLIDGKVMVVGDDGRYLQSSHTLEDVRALPKSWRIEALGADA